MRVTKASLEAECKELALKVNALQHVIRSLQDDRTRLEKANVELRGELARLEIQLEKKEDALENLAGELEDARDELEDLRATSTDMVEVASEDRAKLLGLLGLTEHEWSLRRSSLETYLGKMG